MSSPRKLSMSISHSFTCGEPSVPPKAVSIDGRMVVEDAAGTALAEGVTSSYQLENPLPILFPGESAASDHEQEAVSNLLSLAGGTLIETAGGPRPVERVRRGDKLRLLDGSLQPVAWVGYSRLEPRGLFGLHRTSEAPIVIEAGALGEGTPAERLYVSGNLALLVEGPRAELLFGAPRVLASAQCLINGKTIYRCHEPFTIEYYYIVLNRHDIIFANGAACETYRPPRQNAFGFDSYAMIEALTGISRGQIGKAFMPRFPLLNDAEAHALVSASADWIGVRYQPKADQ
ncbi:MAG: Hint domain-containing protein [Neomegalonema sp.]|nr:Hint domain-containing protein [Neomegalonema sp.]